MRIRFDVVEVLGIVAGCFLLAAAFMGVPWRESGPALIDEDVLARVKHRYGLSKYSQGPEEWLIRDYFNDKQGGVFLDVGAYDARKWSNTYRLERDLRWSGVAVDAIAEFSAGYREFRPRTQFVVAFVGDRDVGTEVLHVNPEDAATSSVNDAFTRLFTSKTVARNVQVRTLDAIAADTGLRGIDLLSMDIELGEPVALAHFTIDRYRPRLAVVEAHGRTRQAILDYFARAQYVVVGRYLQADRQNLYFAPLQPN
jgi:Methyltransferase FkbM domain